MSCCTQMRSGNPLSREEALANLRNHVKTVVEHFGDRVISWDVVNEAMSDNPPNPEDWRASLRNSGWLQAIGPDFIEEAFRAAREVIDENGWDIKLYYNDYNDDNQNKAEAIYQMVKEINERYAAENDGRLLIDGIGMQGHYNLNTNPANVRRSLEKFISLGVEVGVTELDIMAGENHELTEKQAMQQAYLYAQLFQLYKEYADHISRVTFWGLDDGASWRAANSPTLFDSDLQAKPAYYAVIDPEGFIASYDPEVQTARQGQGVYGTPVIDGEIDDVWSHAPNLPLDRYQTAWHGANGTAKVLWDEENLYVLVQVTDSELDKSSANEWEQDSVEIFLDERNTKETFYVDGVGQYRVNFDNETSFNPAGIEEGFESATKVSGTSYTVEVKIPFTEITPEAGVQIGFDVQINDGKEGARQSVAIWNDLSGQGYQDPSVFGVLTLVDEATYVFEDIAHVPWAEEAITELAAHDVIRGVGENRFAPDNKITRADFVALLVRALELQASDEDVTMFADVPASAYYYDELRIAKQLGIATGAADGTFKPTAPITRQDMMVLTVRALEAAGRSLATDGSLAAYTDADLVADYAKDSVAALVESGVIVGKDGDRIAPQDHLTRAEAAVILYRIWQE